MLTPDVLYKIPHCVETQAIFQAQWSGVGMFQPSLRSLALAGLCHILVVIQTQAL